MAWDQSSLEKWTKVGCFIDRAGKDFLTYLLVREVNRIQIVDVMHVSRLLSSDAVVQEQLLLNFILVIPLQEVFARVYSIISFHSWTRVRTNLYRVRIRRCLPVDDIQHLLQQHRVLMDDTVRPDEGDLRKHIDRLNWLLRCVEIDATSFHSSCLNLEISLRQLTDSAMFCLRRLSWSFLAIFLARLRLDSWTFSSKSDRGLGFTIC